jgi:hypothetical protein
MRDDGWYARHNRGSAACANRRPLAAVAVREVRRCCRAQVKGHRMIRGLLVGVGVLLAIAGTVFALQGFGVLGGSGMSGNGFWAGAGPVIAAQAPVPDQGCSPGQDSRRLG